MRTPTSLSCMLLLAACHSVEAPADLPGSHEAQFVDAGYSRVVPRRPLDSSSSAVVASMQRTYELQRQVMLENLCNVDTPGFKRRVAQVVTESSRALGTERVGMGTDRSFQGPGLMIPNVDSILSDFSAGALEATGRSLDLAIDGYGFFSVIAPDGSTRYLRDGRLMLNADAKVVTLDGRVVTPEVTIPADTLDLVVTPQGMVQGRTAGSPDTVTTFGQLTLHRFVNANGLLFEGRFYAPSEASGAPTTGVPGSNGIGLLRQGFIERSNVEIAAELRRLKELERHHRAVMGVLDQEGLTVR